MREAFSTFSITGFEAICTMARLTLARKLASITLTIWKKERRPPRWVAGAPF
jgi:hypothetical protein